MSVASAVGRLLAAFPRQPLSAAQAEAMADELRDIPDRLLQDAVTELIRSRVEPWMPTIGLIRRTCAELALALPSEEDAYQQVVDRIAWGRTGGDEPSAPPLSPVARRALNMVGGFAAFRNGDAGVVRAQFLRSYRGLRDDEIRAAQLAPGLPGPARPALPPPPSDGVR